MRPLWLADISAMMKGGCFSLMIRPFISIRESILNFVVRSLCMVNLAVGFIRPVGYRQSLDVPDPNLLGIAVSGLLERPC